MRNFTEITLVSLPLADDGVVQDVGISDIFMATKTAHGVKNGVITTVWHIPKLSRNLFSVGRLAKDVGPATFECDRCFADTKRSQVEDRRSGRKMSFPAVYVANYA